MTLCGKTVLAVARPILNGEGAGPSHGTLIFGRLLDSAEIARLKERTHVSAITIYPARDSQLPADFQWAQAAISAQPPNPVRIQGADDIAGYVMQKDICRAPASRTLSPS